MDDDTWVDIDNTFSLNNVVTWLSQIGCTASGDTYIDKKISFEKVFIYVDTSSENNIQNRLHSKIPHNEDIIENIFELLSE